MKPYKRKFNEYFKEVLNYRDHKIYDTEHSVARYKERVSDDLFSYERLLKKGINYIIEHQLENKEDRYIFVSKKYGFGIQVHWRKDDKRVRKGFDGYSATTLSNNEMKVFIQKDKEILLENVAYYNNLKSEDIEFFRTKGYARYEFEGELFKEIDLINIDYFIEEGQLYITYEVIKL